MSQLYDFLTNKKEKQQEQEPDFMTYTGGEALLGLLIYLKITTTILLRDK